ncbi:hypothetical protein KCU81_g7094, partial [Aureobasidium melanogenum]
MELEIAPPSCSGIEMVSQNSSSRARLDAATTSELLSAVTPGDSNIMGLGISFDLETSPATSNKSFNDSSMRNSKVRANICLTLERTDLTALQSKAHSTKASNALISTSKASSSAAAVPSQINHGSVSIAINGPPRWPSGVPGLGNTILGPRCPRISNVTCPPIITLRNSPILLPNTTSQVTITLASPPVKRSKATRTSTKRRASSPPSTGLSAKMARVSVDSVPVNSVPGSSPVVKYDQTDEQSMVPWRCGSRLLGLAEGEKRAMAARLWQVEKEKIEKEMERATSHEGVKTLSDGNGSSLGKECSVQEGPQLLNPCMVLESRAEVFALSPKVQGGIEYACDTIDDAPQLSVDHEGSYKVSKHPEHLNRGDRAVRRIAKLHSAASYKQLSQTSPQPSIKTSSQGHTLPSAIKKSAATSTSSNDRKRVSFADQTNLDHLVHGLLALLEPYTHLHFSRSAVRPLQIIHGSLLSIPANSQTLAAALEDTRELLKVLSNHQMATLEKLEGMKEELQRVGMRSVVFEARERIMRTDGDVKKIEEWMGEYKA